MDLDKMFAWYEVVDAGFRSGIECSEKKGCREFCESDVEMRTVVSVDGPVAANLVAHRCVYQFRKIREAAFASGDIKSCKCDGDAYYGVYLKYFLGALDAL